MAFTELIKNFSKTRDYMRDFYIYGFKARGDFTVKSARTYDDEKRRIESWLAPYVRWENDKKGKRVYVSLDTSVIDSNPLYNAWKAKSFTDNDITLHFSILSALRDGQKKIADLTDAVCDITGVVFETQTVRLKANEYVKEGLLVKETIKKTDYYDLAPYTATSLPAPRRQFLDAIRFFRESAPFGFIGSTIIDGRFDGEFDGELGGEYGSAFKSEFDGKSEYSEHTDHPFGFKHHYIVHTLEDGVMLDLLCAMHDKRRVTFVQQSARNAKETTQTGVPMQIFVSLQSGRRFICLYTERNRHFQNYRLDFIKKVKPLDLYSEYDDLTAKLETVKRFCWGVSFVMAEKKQELRMKLFIDEQKEEYVLERLRREGRGGIIEHVEKNTYLYSVTLCDVNEMMAWVKSFTGRIISLESSNSQTEAFFYRDMQRMAALYEGEE